MVSGEWECMNCGRVEIGLSNAVPKRCPACGARGDMLAFFDYAEDFYKPKGGWIMQDSMDGASQGEWECDECGYVKVGVSTKSPKGNCPECGAAADNFTFYEYSDDDWDDEDEAWDWDDEQ